MEQSFNSPNMLLAFVTLSWLLLSYIGSYCLILAFIASSNDPSCRSYTFYMRVWLQCLYWIVEFFFSFVHLITRLHSVFLLVYLMDFSWFITAYDIAASFKSFQRRIKQFVAKTLFTCYFLCVDCQLITCLHFMENFILIVTYVRLHLDTTTIIDSSSCYYLDFGYQFLFMLSIVNQSHIRSHAEG